ncbi:Peroxisomal membrane protein pex16 [Pseudocyphellaria aurata]|nr:Peroxisomal membrane protein pex16 [Pseudocyphellaria aurata]
MKSLYKQAQSRIPATISLPATWLRSYEEFVTKNASQVSQIESALRSLSYIIPGRFRESELASESLHASLLLLSHYHTTLFSPPPRPSPHNRYTRFWSKSSPLYARVSLLLRTIQYTELLCEMCAKRHSEKLRWRLVVALELVKAVCRFIILRVTGGRMGVSPPVAEREGVVPPESGGDASGDEEDEGRGKEWQMPRTGMRLPALPPPSGASITNFLSHRVISADEIKSAHRLMRRLTSLQGQIAEAMWIVRPLVYALAMQRLRGNKRDWRPWVLGLTVELAARGLGTFLLGLSALLQGKVIWGNARVLPTFADRVQKPRRWIQGFAERLKGKPLLDMLSAVVEDYDFLWDEYYFSTATM